MKTTLTDDELREACTEATAWINTLFEISKSHARQWDLHWKGTDHAQQRTTR